MIIKLQQCLFSIHPEGGSSDPYDPPLDPPLIMVHNKGNFEKVPGHNFFKLSLNIHTSIWLCT